MFGYRRGEDKKLGNREILVDTSIIIDYLRKQKKEKALLWKLSPFSEWSKASSGRGFSSINFER